MRLDNIRLTPGSAQPGSVVSRPGTDVNEGPARYPAERMKHRCGFCARLHPFAEKRCLAQPDLSHRNSWWNPYHICRVIWWIPPQLRRVVQVPPTRRGEPLANRKASTKAAIAGKNNHGVMLSWLMISNPTPM